jgi:hypothetical protein
MLTKILIGIFILSGCGRDVQLKPNKLENLSALSDAQKTAFEKQGIFIKEDTNKIVYMGTTYTISKYSSKVSFDFINSIPLGYRGEIIFTGGINGNQIVVESIRKK